MIKVIGADAMKELIRLLISTKVGKPKVKPEVKPEVKLEVKREVKVKPVAKPGKIGQMPNEKTFRFRRPRAVKKNGNPFLTFF